MSTKAMTIAGVMSGTSADGIDVAVVRILPGRQRAKLTLLAHEGFPYPAALRNAILAAMNAASISTAELARLNWRLGLEYADAIRRTVAKHGARIETGIDLIGCHGQTLYHQARTKRYAGRNLACTWQLGEPAVIAQALRVPVVSNFRPADMAAGGQGAPLVSLLDYVLFADAKRGRVLQNIGGIANLTAIPAGAGADTLIAFDTGPGNMVIDALVQKLFDKPYDRNGAIAARGKVIPAMLSAELRHRYYRIAPPRTAGREEFGREYAESFVAACKKHSKNPEDAVTTATALTAESITRSYARFVAPKMQGAKVDYIVSGGGARNRTLMMMLEERLTSLGCELASIDGFGLPAEAKEAAAFALLAWQTWYRLPGNVPAATGAERAVVLGQVTYV
ncbi:anhydro-N-acetylmuramic acid kinase [Terracidiphilus sp.]|jgi:anhydro-N-acetylmuramic acid kinase|uniref:anhydro-N-acetylmuramic acid kinase n=1 Tax=Terracidiphilus sp. TaxID=1964191 RepID=UPI003C13A1F2